MRKFTLLFILAVFALGGTNSYGQKKFRHNYVNLGFATQTITNNPLYERRGIGGVFNIGRSFILHRTPVAGMWRFGIDATWLDVSYVNHRNIGYTHFTLGAGIGPAVHIDPTNRLGIHAYFRFMPSYALIDYQITPDLISGEGEYVSFFTTGGAVSWGMLSLGVEARWGNITPHRNFHEARPTMQCSGLRIYAGIRF